MKTELALLMTYDKPIMSLEQVAELLGVGARTLENKIYAQECPVPMFKLGSKWSAHVADVAAYIDAQRAAATNLLQTALQGA